MKLGIMICVLIVSCWGASGWSGAGHMVIAAQAYRELPIDVKGKVSALLKAHPEYQTWENAFEPSPGMDLPLFVFMKASAWPDQIRRKGNEYDHPHWHYINYPLEGPGFAVKPGPAPKDDILYGIEQSEKAISDKARSMEERAIYLSWLIHLIGDLHQPLHCAALVSEAYPSGDKGGNDFYIKPGSTGIKLHSFWDGLLGTRNHPQTHLNEAIRLAAEYPRATLPELSRITAKEWSLEGRALAVDRVYLRGRLTGGKSGGNAPALPEGYAKGAKALAERRAALASYRLAGEITKWVK